MLWCRYQWYSGSVWPNPKSIKREGAKIVVWSWLVRPSGQNTTGVGWAKTLVSLRRGCQMSQISYRIKQQTDVESLTTEKICNTGPWCWTCSGPAWCGSAPSCCRPSLRTPSSGGSAEWPEPPPCAQRPGANVMKLFTDVSYEYS